MCPFDFQCNPISNMAARQTSCILYSGHGNTRMGRTLLFLISIVPDHAVIFQLLSKYFQSQVQNNHNYFERSMILVFN
jgi:hypothetical protein